MRLLVATTRQEKAIQFASRKHAGQVHRDGRPAIEHPLRVAENFTHDPELYCIAVMHDVIEDAPFLVADHDFILKEFGPRVMAGMWALSRGKTESWSHYIRRVIDNPDAVLVKIADIHDNVARADEKFRAKLPMYLTTLTLLYQC